MTYFEVETDGEHSLQKRSGLQHLVEVVLRERLEPVTCECRHPYAIVVARARGLDLAFVATKTKTACCESRKRQIEILLLKGLDRYAVGEETGIKSRSAEDVDRFQRTG